MNVIESWNNKISRIDLPYTFVEGQVIIDNSWDHILKAGQQQWVYVLIEVQNGVGKSSQQMAIETDDNIQHYFAYRDWTSSGLPFIKKGDKYWSGFWFQKLVDAQRFQQRYGGVGNWMDEFEEVSKTYVENRNKQS